MMARNRQRTDYPHRDASDEKLIPLIVACYALTENTPTCAEDVMITSEFYRRGTRTQNPAIELDALHHLAQFLAAEPELLLHELAAVLVRACDAESAGVTLEERRDTLEELQWASAAGQLMPKHRHRISRHSPSGAVVDRQQTQLFRRPERFYTGLLREMRNFEELLVVPWQLSSGRRGTIWIASHEPSKHFDPEDLRLLKALGNFTRFALQRNGSEESLRSCEALASATRLANKLAHEINNPLQALMNSLYLVLPSVHDEHLLQACVQARRLAELVQSVLEVKRLDESV